MMGPEPHDAQGSEAGEPLDLEAVATDLADVEIALHRLEAGTYFDDEETGEPLPPELLATRPTLRSRATS